MPFYYSASLGDIFQGILQLEVKIFFLYSVKSTILKAHLLKPIKIFKSNDLSKHYALKAGYPTEIRS